MEAVVIPDTHLVSPLSLSLSFFLTLVLSLTHTHSLTHSLTHIIQVSLTLSEAHGSL